MKRFYTYLDTPKKYREEFDLNELSYQLEHIYNTSLFQIEKRC